MDFEKPMRTRFRENLPMFVDNINPIELLPYLPCLGDHNSVSREEVTSCQTHRTRSQAVQILHGHLIRKKDGCRQLVDALRSSSINQAELADLLDPPQSSEPWSLGPQAGHSEESLKAKAERRCDAVKNTPVRPIDGSTLLQDLPFNLVYRMLDHGLPTNNWRGFAANLHIYKSSEIYDLEKQESPGTAVVNDWIQKQNPTLEMLIKKLDEIERKDMIDELEKVTNYKHPSLDPPTVEERKYTYERNEVERSIETDEQTSLKMGQNEFIKVPYDAYSNWQQKQKEGLDAIMRIEKDSDKTMERMGNDTGYNTSASSSERFDSDRNDSSMESKISDSSLEMDGPISMSINIDGANYPGMKLRYTPTNSGRLAINAVDSDDRNEILLDGERSSFMNQNQRVIRQESIETCRNPIQTEPSLNSNQFIDLKEERLTQVVRPKRPSLKVTIPLVAPEAEQVPHSQQQVVSLESYVKLHTQDAPTLHDMSSAQNTPEDIRDRTMSSQSGISDTCEFNSARSENETPLTSESGFHHLDLSSITSENSELFGHGNIDNSESSRDHYLEPAAMRDVLGIASQSLRENLNTGLDMEAASCSIASAATNSTRSLHRNEDEFSVSTTDSSVSGNSGSITDLKRRQIEADFSNVGNDNSGELASGTNEGRENIPRQSRSGSLTSLGLGDVASGTNEGRGSDIPQSRSLPTLTSLGIGIAAGILIVTAYNKFK